MNQFLTTFSDDEHVLRPHAANIQVLVYGDYACPKTASLDAALREYMIGAGEDLAYIYRHCPTQPSAWKAAECAVAASMQGAFWPMHRALLANQSELDDASLLEHSLTLSLDANRLLRDLADGQPRRKVLRDVAAAAACGVSSAPGVFIQGHRVDERIIAGDMIQLLIDAS